MVELATNFTVVDGACQITDISGAVRQNLLFNEVLEDLRHADSCLRHNRTILLTHSPVESSGCLMQLRLLFFFLSVLLVQSFQIVWPCRVIYQFL